MRRREGATIAKGMTPDEPASSPTFRAGFRALLLLFILLIQLFIACPLPREGVTLKSPESREELQRWLVLSERLGVSLTQEELASGLNTLGSWTGSLRRDLMKPWLPLQRMTGTGQRWAFFAVPDTHPVRLEVSVEEPEGSRMVFRRLDSDHRWRASAFAYRRVRGLYDGARKKNALYRNFVEWVADQAFEDHPRAEAVEVQVMRYHTTLPGEPEDAKLVPRLRVHVEREAP